MTTAKEYLDSVEKSWKIVTLPASKVKFTVGPLPVLTFLELQNLYGDDFNEFAGADATDPEVKEEIAKKIKSTGLDTGELINLVIPAVCRKPVVKSGVRENDKSTEYLYVSDLHGIDALYLLNMVQTEISMGEAKSFLEEQDNGDIIDDDSK